MGVYFGLPHHQIIQLHHIRFFCADHPQRAFFRIHRGHVHRVEGFIRKSMLHGHAVSECGANRFVYILHEVRAFGGVPVLHHPPFGLSRNGIK